jgi:hypothetical protein
LTEAVSGDFYGWTHGFLAVGAVAVLLVVHELFAFGQQRVASALTQSGPRNWEALTYAVSGAAFWLLNRAFEHRLAGMT